MLARCDFILINTFFLCELFCYFCVQLFGGMPTGRVGNYVRPCKERGKELYNGKYSDESQGTKYPLSVE